MKRLLTLTLIVFVAILQSCDERINPSQNEPVEVRQPTKMDILTANSWQYNEVTIKGGSVTKVAFSKIANPAIQLSSDYAFTAITYNTDSTGTTNVKGGIDKFKWKFVNDESQIQVTKNDAKKTVLLYNIDLLTKENLNLTNIDKKAFYSDDAFWIGYITNLGLPNTINEFSNIGKLVPLK